MKSNDFFVIVFLGTNGCGKTTLANRLASSLKIPYFNIDELGKQYFSHINDYNKKMTLSANLVSVKSDEMFIKQQSFITEFTLSNPKDLEFLNRVKVSGAKLVTIFVLTKDVEINISRAKKRVSEGGHNVPEYKIRERYPKCFADMGRAVEVSDVCFIFENDYVYKMVLVKREAYNLEVVGNHKDDWLDNRIIKPLEVNNQITFSTTVDDRTDNKLFNNLFTLLSSHIKELKERICLL